MDGCRQVRKAFGKILRGDCGRSRALTRERSIIHRFLSSEGPALLITNPASCSESISLHSACRSAIYLDRTYDCALYLQSIDRIHRLGLPADADVTDPSPLGNGPREAPTIDHLVEAIPRVPRTRECERLLEGTRLAPLNLSETPSDDAEGALEGSWRHCCGICSARWNDGISRRLAHRIPGAQTSTGAGRYSGAAGRLVCPERGADPSSMADMRWSSRRQCQRLIDTLIDTALLDSRGGYLRLTDKGVDMSRHKITNTEDDTSAKRSSKRGSFADQIGALVSAATFDAHGNLLCRRALALDKLPPSS